MDTAEHFALIIGNQISGWELTLVYYCLYTVHTYMYIYIKENRTQTKRPNALTALRKLSFPFNSQNIWLFKKRESGCKKCKAWRQKKTMLLARRSAAPLGPK